MRNELNQASFKLLVRLWLSVVVMLLISSGSITAAADRPNIVIILADDLGYGSLNSYGADLSLIHTPNIDRLAEQGRRFTDANTPSSVCSPTR